MPSSDTEPTTSRLGSLWARFKGGHVGESFEMQEAAEEGRATPARPAGENPESGLNNLRYYDKCDDIPEGWPRFAHDQNRGHNRSIHRRFGDFNQRLLLDYQITLKLIRDDIIQLDKADEKADSQILRGLSPHPSRDNGDGLGRFEKKRELIREAKEILPKYYELLLMDREVRGLSRISRIEHQDFYLHIEENKILDETAREYLYEADDFVTTRTDRAHESLEWLVYGDNRFHKFLRKHFVSKKDSKGRLYVDKDRLIFISICVIVGLTLGLLLSPMLILFLANLSRWQSALVVIIFGIVSATGMSRLRHVKSDTVFIAMSAYMAVLVTFLANLQGGQCQCG